ncbi:MAG TPA: CBS domain-containing protein [Ilumatobacteraceae bacterium]|jgi:CBS domain-containing protein|nr:CBS domain-containing protein [Ilumatobacteraceae bacterium]
MKVTEILHRKGADVITIWPGASLQSAVERMASRNIGALVVVDDEGKIVGMVSERDVVLALAASAEKAPAQSVTDVMSRRLLTCGPDDSLAELMAVMTEHRVRHLPVVDHGQLLGLVSIGDLVKARLGELEFESHVLRDAYLRVR